eukprot:scaffold14533_cov118-Isochrysis_galbana.AAC.5
MPETGVLPPRESLPCTPARQDRAVQRTVICESCTCRLVAGRPIPIAVWTALVPFPPPCLLSPEPRTAPRKPWSSSHAQPRAPAGSPRTHASNTLLRPIAAHVARLPPRQPDMVLKL